MEDEEKKTLIREDTFGKKDSDVRRQLRGEKVEGEVLAEERLGVETQERERRRTGKREGGR